MFRFTAGKVSGDHRIPVISGRSTVDTPTACQSRPGQGPIVRRDLTATPDRAARRRVTIISAPAGSPGRHLRSSARPGTCNLSWRARSERPGDGWLLATQAGPQNHRDQVTAAHLDGRYFARTRSLSREGAVPVTSALAPDPLARGILCSCSRRRAPGAGPSKPSVPQVPSRITVIWWRLLTCLAASLVVVRLLAGISALVRHERPAWGAVRRIPADGRSSVSTRAAREPRSNPAVVSLARR
jgi:hypothetical protein